MFSRTYGCLTFSIKEIPHPFLIRSFFQLGRIAFSNNFFERLHPDDAMDHLLHINRVLVKGGTYMCMTENRLNGPHDISKYFSNVAKGFHLKEYTNFDLEKLFKAPYES